MHLYEQDSYIASFPALLDHYIREYDISKANINILLYLNLISKQQYMELYNADRMTRQITVGYMQKNPKIAKGLSDGFRYMRTVFCESNGIEDSDILSIKKDAIYIIDKVPSITSISNQFNTVEFVVKNVYTSWYRLDKVEYYYNLDRISNSESLDVKGISDTSLELHSRYMLDFLKYVFGLSQMHRYQDALYAISKLISDINNQNVDINFYRELNNRSLFRTKIVIDQNNIYLSGFNYKVKLSDIDPSYNVGLLMDLYKIYAKKVVG